MIFSISIPVRGQSKFVSTALESIRCQRSKVDLAVMDATPDNSVQDVLRDYRSLIAYTYHRADAGQSAAIQEGWDNTHGDIVAWLNADDCYFPGALARVEAAFRSRPDVDVVYGHGADLNEEGAFLRYFPFDGDQLARIQRENVICQPTCFVRRSAMERVGGLNVQLHYVMDWEFWLRLLKGGSRFLFLDTPLAAVTVHPETKTLSGAKSRYREISSVLAPNVPRTERILSLTRMRSHDLLNRPAQGLVRVLRPLARITASLDWRLRRPREPLVLFGIEVGTQWVMRECLIQLPRFASGTPASRLRVITDTPARLEGEAAGRTFFVEPIGATDVAFAGRVCRATLLEGHLPEPLTGPGMMARIRGPDRWRLISVQFLPALG